MEFNRSHSLDKRNILVTGGAGFIGSHVVDRLVKQGCAVSVLDNLSTGMLENLQYHVNNKDIDFVKGDILNNKLVKRLVKGAEAIVHLAAVTSVPFSVKHPVLTNRVNVNGVARLLKACLDNDVQRFLFFSSCAVYGEPSYFPVDEIHPTCPLSPYALSKLTGEQHCQHFRSSHGLEIVVLRPFNVYGPRQRKEDMYGGVIARFVDGILYGKPIIIYGDGLQSRDFVHVYDVVEAVWLALNKCGVEGQLFNVGFGRPVKINVLAKMLIEFSGKSVEILHHEQRKGDLRHSYADITKAKEKLEYNPKVSLKEGLSTYVQYPKL